MVKEYSTEKISRIMRFKKVFPSAQGFSIFGDEIFQLYHTGKCAIYDLKNMREEPKAVFPLASSNEGIPSKDHINHSNQCMFSHIFHKGNSIPLLYVTTGNSLAADEDGFVYRCAVENIHLRRDSANNIISAESELLQTISYKAGDMTGLPFIQPCFGCPAWFVDDKNGHIYIFSAIYRTTLKEHAAENKYIITKFPMPDPNGPSKVVLGPQDIIDQFTAPFDIMFTQGGMIEGDKLYYTFGFGTEEYPDGMRVYDLKKRCLCGSMDLKGTLIENEEVESVSFYGDDLIINTNTEGYGSYYTLGKQF